MTKQNQIVDVLTDFDLSESLSVSHNFLKTWFKFLDLVDNQTKIFNEKAKALIFMMKALICTHEEDDSKKSKLKCM